MTSTDPSGRIVLPVQVDGTPHTFVIDTSTRSTISSVVARALNRTSRPDRPGVRVIDDVSLELLGVLLPHQVLQLSAEQMLDDGIVGAALCNRFIVKVDFHARRITLWERSAAIDTRHAVITPADFSNEVPVIKANIRAVGMRPSAATLIVGLAVPPRTVSLSYGYAAENGLKVEPWCGYVRSYMRRHPETQRLLADGFRI